MGLVLLILLIALLLGGLGFAVAFPLDLRGHRGRLLARGVCVPFRRGSLVRPLTSRSDLRDRH